MNDLILLIRVPLFAPHAGLDIWILAGQSNIVGYNQVWSYKETARKLDCICTFIAADGISTVVKRGVH